MLAQPAHHISRPQLELVVEDRGTTRTVCPWGEIDVFTAARLREVLMAAVAERFEIVVLDFAETTFMDSMGVHAVLAAEAYAGREGVRFVLLPGPPAVQRVFEISGIQTREEAARPCARA